MNRPYELLHEIRIAQAASINNLSSYEADTVAGASLYVRKQLKEYIAKGLVRQVPFNVRPSHSRRQYLYQLTKKGYDLIGRENEYHNKDHQSYNKINHESMKYDVVISFKRNFPDYDFHVEYEKTLKTASGKGLRADIYLVATKLDQTKQFSFLIETEHKDFISDTFKAKVLPYEKAVNDGLFKVNGLPEKTKVLFVCACSHLSTFLRPQEYELKQNRSGINLSYQQFDTLMTKVKQHFTTGHDKKNNPIVKNGCYLFLPFVEYYRLNEPIWRVASGEKRYIIE